MKKFHLFLMLLLMTVCATFVGCTPEEPQEGEDNTVYSVTVPQSEFFLASARTVSASAGLDAYVEIVPNFAGVCIDQVFYNGLTCTVAEDNTYNFVMPAANVAIKVDYSFVDIAEDGFLQWEEHSLVMAVAEGDYYAQFDADNKLTATVFKTPSGSGGYFSSHTQEVFSTNQDVVPDEALSVEPMVDAHRSNTNSFLITVDRSKIAVGTTQIVLLVKNGHSFGDASLLVCTLTVTEQS